MRGELPTWPSSFRVMDASPHTLGHFPHVASIALGTGPQTASF